MIAATTPTGFFGEELDERGAVGHFAFGFRQRLALFQGHQAGQVVGVLIDQLKPAAQQGRALFDRGGAPGGTGFISGGYGVAGVVGAQVRHMGDGLAGGGVVHREGLLALAPLPAHQGRYGIVQPLFDKAHNILLI